MKLSFVIPMFNAEPFIEKCIGSILSEIPSSDEAEIIVIDDGSTDNGYSLVSKILAGHSNTTLISQRNAGQSASRNKGIDLAKGEYIWFVDADDWIMGGSVGKLLEVLDESKTQGCPIDILGFGMENIFDESGATESIFRYNTPFKGDGPSFIIKKNESLKVCVPLFLFRRKFLVSNRIHFMEGVFHEDAEFTPKAVFLAKHLVTSTAVYYGRRLHPMSTTHQPNKKRTEDILKVISMDYRFMLDNIQDKRCKRAFCSLISNFANYGCKIASSISMEAESEYNDVICSFGWLGETLRHSSKLKYIIEGILLSLFPHRFAQIHNMLVKLK